MNRVAKILNEAGIAYQLHLYEEVKCTAEEAAEKLGWRLEQIVKTLVVKGKRTGFHIVLVPGGSSIDWSKLAKALGDCKVHLASEAEVTKQTGYIIGSVSPLGTVRTLPVLMETSVLEQEKIGINGGERGVEIELVPSDLQRVTQAQAMDVCRS